MRPSRRLLVAGIAVVLGAIAIVALLTAGGGRKSATDTAATNPNQPQPAPTQPARTGPKAQSTGTQTPRIPPPTPAQRIGVSVNILFDTPGKFSTGQIDSQLRAVEATGARVARSDALWAPSEPTPPAGGVHHYQWTFDDSVAGALAAHRLEWLPIVDYSAAWAQPAGASGHPPPSSPADFAAYAGALAARYGPGGSFWRSHPEVPPTPVDTYEIWNEPDNPIFWSPSPDPAHYGELYVRAKAAIDAVDPAAHVITGGLAHPDAFLPALMTAMPQLRGQIDGVAIHPYGRTPGAVLARVRAARRTLQSVGLGSVPLYVTEFGWTTRPAHTLNWASPAQRPGYISRALAALAHTDCGVSTVILYTWVTRERDPLAREDWYGIYSPQGRSTADSEAFAAGLRAGTQPGPDIKLCG